MRLKEGDNVRVVVRECTPADKKEGTFYPHFCGLTGTVDKIYDKEVCVRVDLESLPEDILKRHLEVQESIRRKWLNGLSGEVRNRLSAEEKRFELAYAILVQPADLEKTGESKAVTSKHTDKPPVMTAEEAAALPKTRQEAHSAKTGPADQPAKTTEPKKRTSSKADTQPKENGTPDLTDAELAFLKEREKALKGRK